MIYILYLNMIPDKNHTGKLYNDHDRIHLDIPSKPKNIYQLVNFL